jgi:hypothetical protein
MPKLIKRIGNKEHIVLKNYGEIEQFTNGLKQN